MIFNLTLLRFPKYCGGNIAEAHHTVKIFSLHNALKIALNFIFYITHRRKLHTYGRSRSITTVMFSVPGLIG